jgi:hypothetical protein
VRDYVNGDVELDLKRREAIRYGGFRVGIHDGGEQCRSGGDKVAAAGSEGSVQLWMGKWAQGMRMVRVL